MKQTFIVPGLLDPVPYLEQLPAAELPELALFSTFLSRGKFSRPDFPDHDPYNLYTCLLRELQLEALIGAEGSPAHSAVKQTPVASISYVFDQLEQNGSKISAKERRIEHQGKWLMRIDPCFMAADRDQLILAQTGNLGLSLAEAKLLVAAINNFYQDFAEESFWTLEAVSPDRWYLVSDKPIRVKSVPPEKVLGQSLKSFLLTGEDSRHWIGLFNEFQMILHQSPVNKERMRQNKLPINSLWFWGAGEVISLADIKPIQVGHAAAKNLYSDHVFSAGIAQLLQQASFAVPDKYEFNKSLVPDHEIYLMEKFINAIYNKDIFTWVGLLEQFENDYLVPLAEALKSGRISEVEFVSPTGVRLLLTRKLLNRWWQRKQPFFTFLSSR